MPVQSQGGPGASHWDLHSGVAKSWSRTPFKPLPHGNQTWLSLVPFVGTWVAWKGPAVAGVRPGRAWQEVPWGSPEAGGFSLGSCLFLAENGVLRNGTEEVVPLEQYPPTKRLKTYPCNSSKEQRVEEDQTRGNQQRELGSGLAWAVHPESTGKPFWERFGSSQGA